MPERFEVMPNRQGAGDREIFTGDQAGTDLAEVNAHPMDGENHGFQHPHRFAHERPYLASSRSTFRRDFMMRRAAAICSSNPGS